MQASSSSLFENSSPLTSLFLRSKFLYLPTGISSFFEGFVIESSGTFMWSAGRAFSSLTESFPRFARLSICVSIFFSEVVDFTVDLSVVSVWALKAILAGVAENPAILVILIFMLHFLFDFTRQFNTRKKIFLLIFAKLFTKSNTFLSCLFYNLFRSVSGRRYCGGGASDGVTGGEAAAAEKSERRGA